MDINKLYNDLKVELESNTDGFYVITPSSDKEKLDDAYQKYNAQNSDQKLKADTRSLALYGMNNYDHYHILLSKLKKGTKDDEVDGLSYNKDDKDIVQEAYDSFYEIIRDFNCYDEKDFNQKVESIIDFNMHTTGRVILYPTIDANELESLYMKYMALDMNNKASSDNKAHEVFGKTNREIYSIMKDYINSKSGNIEDTHEVEDENIEDLKYSDSLFTNDLPLVTPEELSEKIDEDYSCFNSEDKDIIKAWRESYFLLGTGIKSENYNSLNLKRINILRRAIYEDNSNAILQCGWIPGIEFNSENRVKATKIIKEKMNIDTGVIEYDSLNESVLLESSNKENKKAISIVMVSGNSLLGKTIKKIQNNEFSHVSVSLDDDLKRIYSFNMRGEFNGLAYESMKQYIQDGVDKVGVYTFLVADSVYKKLENILDNFNLYRNKTRYSILNLLTIPLNIPLNMDMKLVCSEFVDKLLKAVSLDITNKKSYFVSPKDFSGKVKNNAKIVEIFKDHPNKYNSSEIKKKIEKLKKSNFPIYEFVEYDDSIITEAKSFPVQFDTQGNLIIKNIQSINFEQEYADSHRLLKEYEGTNSYEPMKFELSKMQFFITLLEKKIYKKGKDKSIAELKVRARFLNDFKKYLKIIMANDKSFNFTEYYEKSPFNDALIKIDNSTLKFGLKGLKYIMKTGL